MDKLKSQFVKLVFFFILFYFINKYNRIVKVLYRFNPHYFRMHQSNNNKYFAIIVIDFTC